MDLFIKLVYGDPPPPKRANVIQAAQLASEELLMEEVDRSEVKLVAEQLASGPIPYSTHDLALSVAVNFFRRPELKEQLRSAQIGARVKMLQWVIAGSAAKMLAKNFEDTLYELYKR